MPVYKIEFPSDPTNEYAAKMTTYLDGIRLMSVEVEVIKMIAKGVIPKMNIEKLLS